MDGIVMMSRKGDIIDGIDQRLQGMDDDKEKISFLCEFLHDTLAYLDEEELNEVKDWVIGD